MVRLTKITNEIWQIDLNSMTTFTANAYLIKSDQNILIDTGSTDEKGMNAALKNLNLTPDDINLILYTHGHYDHIGLGHLFKKAEHKMSKHDSEYTNNKRDDFSGRQWLCRNGKYPHIDTNLKNNEKINLGKYKLTTIHTPGHTEGHYIFLEEKYKLLFAGDLLFPQNSIGRTDLLTGNQEKMDKSLKLARKLNWKILLSGHGEPEQR